jgi:hypothetical protein
MTRALYDHGDVEMNLVASRSKETGKSLFPQIPSTSPASVLYEPIQLSDVATIYSFTVIHPGKKTGLPPFTMIYADYPEGVRVMGRLGGVAVIGVRVRARAIVEESSRPSASTYSFELVED